ncbi:hypothetical protein AB0L82_02910 [Nocardia sp. NPDC052001]|uniref:hypothetical protein n=1 Tax=Nocardia sp. NPDC052001 TaxID=3154853 RepID=UPI003440EBE2
MRSLVISGFAAATLLVGAGAATAAPVPLQPADAPAAQVADLTTGSTGIDFLTGSARSSLMNGDWLSGSAAPMVLGSLALGCILRNVCMGNG